MFPKLYYRFHLTDVYWFPFSINILNFTIYSLPSLYVLCLSNVCQVLSLIVHASYCNFLMHFLSALLIIVVNFPLQIISINFSFPLIIVHGFLFSIVVNSCLMFIYKLQNPHYMFIVTSKTSKAFIWTWCTQRSISFMSYLMFQYFNLSRILKLTMPLCLVSDSNMFPRLFSSSSGPKSPLGGTWFHESIINPLEGLPTPNL